MTRRDTCITCDGELYPTTGHWAFCPKCSDPVWVAAALKTVEQKRPSLIDVGRPAPRPTA